jgi:hypothetical protein
MGSIVGEHGVRRVRDRLDQLAQEVGGGPYGLGEPF